MPGRLIEAERLYIVVSQIGKSAYQVSNAPASFSASFPNWYYKMVCIHWFFRNLKRNGLAYQSQRVPAGMLLIRYRRWLSS